MTSLLHSPLLKRGDLCVREVVFEEATLAERVRQLAAQISADYQERRLVVVGILKGAQLFVSDLVRNLAVPVRLDFISISRYRRGPESKEVRITRDLQTDLKDRHLLLVEDIVDTGLTLHYLVQELQKRSPRSIAVCSLLDRPVLRLADIPMRYVGFNVDEQFLVGYGLDYQDQFRDLPYIANLEI